MAAYSRGSRYTNGELGEFNENTVVFPPAFNFRNVDPIGSYTIQKQDEYRADLISYKVFGQTNLGWLIMLFNGFDSVAQLKQGVTLNIPPRELAE